MDRRFGISTHLFHESRLTREHLVHIAAHGFETVEVFATRSHFDYRDEQAIAQLAEWLSDTRLELHSMHAPIVDAMSGGKWVGSYSNASGNETRRKAAVAETRGRAPGGAADPVSVSRGASRDAGGGTGAARRQPAGRGAAQRRGDRRPCRDGQREGGARGDPEPAVQRRVARAADRGRPRRHRRRHLPRLRPRAPDGRPGRGDRDALGTSLDDARARQRRHARRSPRALSRDPSTGISR